MIRPAEQVNEGLDEILRNCCALMAVKGFHGTSMRDLAQATGRSLSGLYHYFKSKEELLFLINYYGFSTIQETLRKMLEDTADPHARLYAMIYNHISYFASHLDELRVIMFGTQVLTLEESRVIKAVKEDYNAMGQEIVREVYLAQTGKRLDERELARKTYLLFGMMNWIFGWYSPKEHGVPEELVDDAYRTFVCGISNRSTDIKDRSRIVESFDHHKTKTLWHTKPATQKG